MSVLGDWGFWGHGENTAFQLAGAAMWKDIHPEGTEEHVPSESGDSNEQLDGEKPSNTTMRYSFSHGAWTPEPVHRSSNRSFATDSVTPACCVTLQGLSFLIRKMATIRALASQRG